MRDFSEYKASAWALIAANVLPLLGVIFWGWDAFAIVALYWTENVVIGAINVLKILLCNPASEILQESEKTAGRAKGRPSGRRGLSRSSKFFLAPFFAFHYSFFCFVHGVFVFVLFQPGHFAGNPLDVYEGLLGIFNDRNLGWAAAGLAASHLYSFFRNFLVGGEYRRTTPMMLMVEPYARVVVLHVAILFGAWIAMALGSNIGLLILLITGKTVLDLATHLRERNKFAAEKPVMPEEILHEAPGK